MDIVLQIVTSAEYWFGVISAVFVLAAGLFVFLAFLPSPDAVLSPSAPTPDWLKTHAELTRDDLTRAHAARQARADARRWPRSNGGRASTREPR